MSNESDQRISRAFRDWRESDQAEDDLGLTQLPDEGGVVLRQDRLLGKQN